MVNDHLPLVIPHFTAKRIALWVGGRGWSDIYPTQTKDHKGDNDSLIQTRRYFRRVFFILAHIHDTLGNTIQRLTILKMSQTSEDTPKIHFIYVGFNCKKSIKKDEKVPFFYSLP